MLRIREIADDLLDIVDALVVVLDQNGAIAYFNRSCEKLTGYPFEEVHGKCVWDVFLPEDHVEPVKSMFSRLAGGEVPNRHVTPWITRDGGRRLIAWSNAALYDEDGTPRFVVGTGIDVTPQQEAEDALRAQEGRLRAIFETIPDAIITIDEQGTIQSFSPAAERMFGFEADAVVGRNVNVLMPSPYREAHDGYIARYLETGERRIIGIGRMVMGQRNDGTTFPMELSVAEYAENDRRLFLGAVRDVSLRQKAEREVYQLQTELLQASRMTAMSEMYSALAHELNQPLSAVLSYLAASRHLLSRSGSSVPEAVQENMEKAAAQARRAGNIIHRLRQLIEKGETERTVEDAAAVLEEASALALVGTVHDGTTVSFDWQPGLPPVLIDRVQVQQVVINMVRNALEAMLGAETKILEISARHHGDGFVVAAVSDTGPGISEEVADMLFQPFATSKEGGMGIGLSLCRNIVNGHGGRIWMEPRPQGGTVFSFTLPVAPTDG